MIQPGGFLTRLLIPLLKTGLPLLARKGINRAGDGIIRAGYESKGPSKKKVLIPLHPLTNFEIQKILSKWA